MSGVDRASPSQVDPVVKVVKSAVHFDEPAPLNEIAFEAEVLPRDAVHGSSAPRAGKVAAQHGLTSVRIEDSRRIRIQDAGQPRRATRHHRVFDQHPSLILVQACSGRETRVEDLHRPARRLLHVRPFPRGVLRTQRLGQQGPAKSLGRVGCRDLLGHFLRPRSQHRPELIGDRAGAVGAVARCQARPRIGIDIILATPRPMKYKRATSSCAVGWPSFANTMKSLKASE